MKSDFRALIFDMDGTLIDSERIHWQAWKVTLGAHGARVPDYQDFKKYVGVSDEQMAAEFISSGALRLSGNQLVANKCSAYHELIPEIELLPGVEKILERFSGRCRMAVASSSPHREVRAILAHHKLSDYFETVVGGDMVERKKPDPEIYTLTVSRLSLVPADCIAFEDSQSGIAAADSAGLATIAVPHAMSIDHDFSRADAVLASLEEIDAELLKGIRQSRH